MNIRDQVDTLSLMSIQHELAMNIGLNPQLMPMIRRIMKICLRRLSIRRIYHFISFEEGDIPAIEMHGGPGDSLYYFMPSGDQKDILQVSELSQWLTGFFQRSIIDTKPILFVESGLYYHAYPLAQSGAIILERAHAPLPNELVNALVPVFERLRKGCQAAIEHERILLEMERRLLAEKRIEHMAYHDDLTDLPNRRELLLKIDHANKNTNAESAFSILMYIGLDNFRNINDSLGHLFGDNLLIQIANRLAPQTKTGHIARVGGDEFCILYANIAGTDESGRNLAVELARTVLSEIENPHCINKRTISVSSSIGIVIFNSDTGNSDTIISMGSAALKKSKQLGRNTLHFYEKSMATEMEQRLNLDLEMRSALQDNQFELYLQKQVDAEGNLIGAETLIRWNHPEKGLISPAAFIPMAEESGFIVTLSDWILSQACEMIKQLQKKKIITANQHLAVNLSAKQFHQADFVSRVVSILDRTGVSPSNLELEITEGTLLADIDDTISKIIRLKELGIRFSIDDFGTGYSSLAYLKRLPVDRIKIDRAFVMNVDNSPDDAAIINIILSMANHFNLKVIAEGVETESEFKLLKQMGCKEFQGFLFHTPMPIQYFQ